MSSKSVYGRISVDDGYVPYAPVKVLPPKVFTLLATYKIAEPWEYAAGKVQNRTLASGFKWYGAWNFRDPSWYPPEPPTAGEVAGDDFEDYDLNDGSVDVEDYIEYVPEQNYTGFKNFNSLYRSVDLIGKSVRSDGEVGNIVKFDFWPGNGLYVDLCGSPAIYKPVDWISVLVTKVVWIATQGERLRVRALCSGNLRENYVGSVAVGFNISAVGFGTNVAYKTYLKNSARSYVEYDFVVFQPSIVVAAFVGLQTNSVEITQATNLDTQTKGPLLFEFSVEKWNPNTGVWDMLLYDNFDQENGILVTGQASEGVQNILLPEFGTGFDGPWAVRSLGALFGYDDFEDYELLEDTED